MIDLFWSPFAEFAFMRHALLGCVALSLGAAPVGVFLLLRRMSLTGDAMAHAILPGAAVGYLVSGLSLTAMTVGGIGFDKELAASFAQPTHAIDNLGEVLRRFEGGEFDLVALGRALLMDPEWVLKVQAGMPFEPFDITAYGRLD